MIFFRCVGELVIDGITEFIIIGAIFQGTFLWVSKTVVDDRGECGS